MADNKKWRGAAKPKKLDEADPDGNTAADLLGEYMKALEEWGRQVRVDIVRLEGAIGFSSGDPGDPPEGPWE